MPRAYACTMCVFGSAFIIVNVSHMAFHDDDDKEKEDLPEGVVDEVLDVDKDEDEVEDLGIGLVDDEKAWE